MILVTGGARSGKSTFAEEKVREYGDQVLYVATSIPFDEEMKDRIRKHRAQRPAHWETVEAYRDLDVRLQGKLEGKSAVLLDCITVMVTNLMLDMDLDWEHISPETANRMEDSIREQVEKLIKLIRTSSIPFVLVTNEVGMGVVPPSPLGRVFRDVAGRANQLLGKAAEEVYLCVSGIPVKIK